MIVSGSRRKITPRGGAGEPGWPGGWSEAREVELEVGAGCWPVAQGQVADGATAGAGPHQRTAGDASLAGGRPGRARTGTPRRPRFAARSGGRPCWARSHSRTASPRAVRRVGRPDATSISAKVDPSCGTDPDHRWRGPVNPAARRAMRIDAGQLAHARALQRQQAQPRRASGRRAGRRRGGVGQGVALGIERQAGLGVKAAVHPGQLAPGLVVARREVAAEDLSREPMNERHRATVPGDAGLREHVDVAEAQDRGSRRFRMTVPPGSDRSSLQVDDVPAARDGELAGSGGDVLLGAIRTDAIKTAGARPALHAEQETTRHPHGADMSRRAAPPPRRGRLRGDLAPDPLGLSLPRETGTSCAPDRT